MRTLEETGLKNRKQEGIAEESERWRQDKKTTADKYVTWPHLTMDEGGLSEGHSYVYTEHAF